MFVYYKVTATHRKGALSEGHGAYLEFISWNGLGIIVYWLYIFKSVISLCLDDSLGWFAFVWVVDTCVCLHCAGAHWLAGWLLTLSR